MRLYTHEEYLNHKVAESHAERPERLQRVLAHLRTTPHLQNLTWQTPQPASQTQIRAAHSQSHIDFLNRSRPEDGIIPIDPDTWMSPKSLAAAHLAAGAVCEAVDILVEQVDKRAFCLSRPPGHHAERDSAMGFCLLNSVAIGALHALAQPGIERVAILDFDVHHGNGTVDIFKDNPAVLVCSSFQYPYYPNRLHDIVRPNLVYSPLPSGTASNAFRQRIEADWLPALKQHQPDLILISAGFDGHREDPLAQFQLEDEDYKWITELIVSEAEKYAQGRVISTLEGGYDVDALARCVALHIDALQNE